MSRGAARVAGDLVLSGPGIPALPVRVSGSLRDLRIHLPSVSDAARFDPRSVASFSRGLRRFGLSVTILAGRVPLVRLGDADRPVRLHLRGALYTLLTTSPRRVPGLIRSLRAARTGVRLLPVDDAGAPG